MYSDYCLEKLVLTLCYHFASSADDSPSEPQPAASRLRPCGRRRRPAHRRNGHCGTSLFVLHRENNFKFFHLQVEATLPLPALAARIKDAGCLLRPSPRRRLCAVSLSSRLCTGFLTSLHLCKDVRVSHIPTYVVRKMPLPYPRNADGSTWNQDNHLQSGFTRSIPQAQFILSRRDKF